MLAASSISEHFCLTNDDSHNVDYGTISIVYKDEIVTRNGPTINRARQVGRSVLVLSQALRYPVACSRRPNPL